MPGEDADVVSSLSLAHPAARYIAATKLCLTEFCCFALHPVVKILLGLQAFVAKGDEQNFYYGVAK